MIRQFQNAAQAIVAAAAEAWAPLLIATVAVVVIAAR